MDRRRANAEKEEGGNKFIAFLKENFEEWERIAVGVGGILSAGFILIGLGFPPAMAIGQNMLAAVVGYQVGLPTAAESAKVINGGEG